MIELIKQLESSDEFSNWKKENKDSYFCSAFTIIEGKEKPIWQLDYYNSENDKITSFIIDKFIKRQESEKAFKKDETKIKEIKSDDIKIDFDEALNIANKVIKEKYNGNQVNKIILILQNLEKTLWNITFLTSSFNLINIKISCEDGKLISKKIESLLKYKENLS